jgi:hypothetical protein
MAYYSKYRSRALRTFSAQGDTLARNTALDLAAAWGTRATASFVCTLPNPDYALCKTFSDVANKQGEKAANSLLTLGVWGGLVLLATLWESA